MKQDLVYDKHSGELIGYIDLDQTGNELSEMLMTIVNSKTPWASHMLVLMVCGIASNLKYPLAAYATDSVTSHLLYTIMYPAIDMKLLKFQ